MTRQAANNDGSFLNIIDRSMGGDFDDGATEPILEGSNENVLSDSFRYRDWGYHFCQHSRGLDLQGTWTEFLGTWNEPEPQSSEGHCAW